MKTSGQTTRERQPRRAGNEATKPLKPLGGCDRAALPMTYSSADGTTKLSNKGLKISVLDPNASAVCEFLQSHGIEAHAIPYAFGSEQESKYMPLLISE